MEPFERFKDKTFRDFKIRDTPIPTTPEGRYATPSMRSPDIKHCQSITFSKALFVFLKHGQENLRRDVDSDSPNATTKKR